MITKYSCIQNYKKDKNYCFPQEVSKLIRDSLNQYDIPDTIYFEQSWKEYTNSKYPYICQSDFNGDTIQDFVLLLTSKNHREIITCLFLSDKKSYSIYKLEKFNFENNKIPIVLSIERKGIWESATDTTYVKNDGFIIYWITESRNYIYYWDNDELHRFYTD
jgi:hypothetical protein